MSELAIKLRGTPLRLPLPKESGEPLLGEITRGAFANPMFRSVLAKFGKTAFDRSSALMEFEMFLRRIGAGGGTCLEIGTYQGASAIILSQLFKRVICVSVEDDMRRIIKRDIIDYLRIPNIEFYDVQNNAEKRQVVDSMTFDFAYLDGDHVNDTRADLELVKHCGRVLFHEYWPIQTAVWNTVNALPQDEVTVASVDCFAYWERKSG